MLAGVVSLLVVVAVLGFLAWILVSFVPMPEPYKRVVIGVAVLAAVIVVLRWALGAGAVIWPS